jgi:hypothetical protein
VALAHNDPPSPFSSPGVVSNVSLEAFCTKYKISEADTAKLTIIEYKSGNKIVESLADANWQTAGFSILGCIYKLSEKAPGSNTLFPMFLQCSYFHVLATHSYV